MNKIEDGTSKNKELQEKKELENGVKQQVEADQKIKHRTCFRYE